MSSSLQPPNRLASLLVLALAAACGGADADDAELVYGQNQKLQAWQDPAAVHEAGARAASTPRLSYYGGPVLHAAKVVKVEYGAGTYQSFVTGTGASSVAGFFTGVTASKYFDWLVEYDTATPKQTIARGTYFGDRPITPAASRNGATITDVQIQAELSAQITAAKLPAPDANTLYFVYFPKGKHLTSGGAPSCASGGFCAYHGTFQRNGVHVYYAVMPDSSAGSGCDLGCGQNASAFNNSTSVASHEMTEAVTDAAVGLATVYGPPLAWYDAANGEIGDICNGQQGSVAGGNGATYVVQKEWSNARKACVTQ